MTEQKAQEMQQAKQNSTEEAATKAEQADNQTEAAEQPLADVLRSLFSIFEGREPVKVKEEVDKASSPEPSYLFRADDNYSMGDPIGFELGSEDAKNAEVQNPKEHVLDKESGQTSRYVSFSTAISFRGGGGPKRFTKKNKILKVTLEALQKLEAEGSIRIYTPEQVAEMVRQNPKKKISRQANDIEAAMEKNGEILIEGQIPGNLVVWAK